MSHPSPQFSRFVLSSERKRNAFQLPIAVLMLAGCLASCGGSDGGGSEQSMADYPASCNYVNFTNANFSTLQIGMGSTQVAALFGCQGVLRAGAGNSLTYEWTAIYAGATQNGSFSYTYTVDATFADGRLSAFSKSGF
jgi:hypothetical protein